MVDDTKPSLKCCSRCGSEKEVDKFIKKRNICKICSNERRQEIYHAPVLVAEKKCTSCNLKKPSNMFLKNRSLCNACNNEKRRDKYNHDEELRQKLIQNATIFKQAKAEERRQKKEKEIGKDNKKCSKCSTIKPMSNFRYNRLKCKICERDDPLEKLKRSIRRRTWDALNSKKNKHTIEYLGCDSETYLQWILNYNADYTIENRDKWHIDHVIPISHFDLDNPDEQLIAFNWRNTMPLSARENLAKNNRIIVTQIEQHYNHLLEYNKEKNIELPQVFIDLFARYLVAGNPLEPSLPLTTGNICEELG
jgi:hypothetical protein